MLLMLRNMCEASTGKDGSYDTRYFARVRKIKIPSGFKPMEFQVRLNNDDGLPRYHQALADGVSISA